jgi:hypothetical protein
VTLGASDSQLSVVRQSLAAAYVKQAEAAITRNEVTSIRTASDAAERYQAASGDVTRLRAAAFKVEGEQKAKFGDLSGALAALEEAVNLDSNLGLKTERVMLHVKLGENAVTTQSFAAAKTHLESAISLDKSAPGIFMLAVSISEPVFVAFERDATKEHQTAALTALSSLESIDAQNVALPVLRKRVTAVLLKRGESLAVNSPDSALADYEIAVSLGASASESGTLQVALVTALTMRCRESLAGQNVGKASADYSAVAKLDSQGASSLIADFVELPTSVLSELPPAILSQLPASVLAPSAPFKNSVGMSFKLLHGGPDGSFSIGVYEVTQKQYEAVMGSNPSRCKGANNPVDNVSWYEAVAFCAKLSSLRAEVAAGRIYRLPTEAEWEYACRAGTTTEYSFGDDERDLGKYEWFKDNSGDTTHAVGEKLPNGWGLYDMHGNVWEWCSDEEGSDRVFRGGSWSSSAGNCRSAYRFNYDPSYRVSFLGFRLALSPSGQ